MIGKTVSHYTILEKLGQGGMGIVYKAEDTKLKRTVALKFLSPHSLGGDEEKARFVNEARNAAALHHPNICTIHEIDEIDGQTFIAMAYCEGEELKNRIAKGPLPLHDTISIALQAANALQAAHEKSIIHRDIKSANIMIDAHGQATIMDFGLAKHEGQTQLTQEGMTVGTVAYMSPEQAQGGTVDQRSDVWSLGVVLFEMITGRLPFRADAEAAILYRIINEDVEPVTSLRTDIPVAFERIIEKALAKDRHERYQSMTDMMVDLRRADRELESSGVKASPPREIEHISFMRDLLNRRVPLITGVYVVVSVGFLLLIRWLADRYPISPNVPDFSAALFASMIPTVVMLAYFHGKPGRNPWTRVERIGIPANVLAAVALLFVLFQGRDLGASTTVVETTNEEGQTVERAVPKSEFRKRVGLFCFDNESGKPEYDWVQYGMTELLWYDLAQDIYVETYYGFVYQHRNAGFESPIGSPLTLKRKIARDARRNFFVTGSFSLSGDEYVIRTNLYDTKSGKMRNERTVTGRNMFEMADSLSLQLRRDMGVPSYHIEESPDLPVAEVLTASEEAFKLYAVSEPLVLDNDYRQAGTNLIEAVEIDPTFAAAHFFLWQVYLGLGEREEQAKDEMRKAIQHRYKLPEEHQYELRSLYQLYVNEDADAGMEVAQEWVTLYPHSIKAHKELANYYEMLNETDKAVEHREAILELDPDQAGELHTISNLYAGQGKPEKALEYSQRYADRLPDRFDAYTHLAGVYTNMGDLEKAKASYEKALTIEPDDVVTLINLGVTESKLGHEANSDRIMDRALVVSKSPSDSLSVYFRRADTYRIDGEVSKSVDYVERYMDVYARQFPPTVVIYTRAEQFAHYYAEAGRVETAFEILSTVERSMQGTIEKASVGEAYFNTYHVIDDAAYLADLKTKIQLVESAIDKFKMESERWRVFPAKALTAHWEGNHAEAAAHYERAIELIPKVKQNLVRNFRLYAGRCNREAGNLPAALDHFEKALAYNPQHPMPNYGISLVYHDMGEREKAMTHLAKALDLWKNAEPVYKPAQAARATLAEWQAAGPQ